MMTAPGGFTDVRAVAESAHSLKGKLRGKLAGSRPDERHYQVRALQVVVLTNLRYAIDWQFVLLLVDIVTLHCLLGLLHPSE